MSKPPAALPCMVPEAGRIVSSQHLVSPRSPELSELEYGMILAWNAFSRWMIRASAATGVPDMTALDVLVLHHVAHRERGKRLADICFVLNVEDTHVVSYSLRKLAGLGLVRSERRGKEAFFFLTDKGCEVCLAYRDVRESCLMEGFSGSEEDNARIGELAALLRMLSGRYDQAARAAATAVPG
ncbi:winged helix DNA-binding protein [Azoarcus sp. TTM-91]|uniref:Putative MarR family transcription regulator n=1 Tax=Azoarcus indigens TaxID=29545 RepID=A0A4R6DSA9_9RHOO|nr:MULTISPECIES: winged helix DNA-binding protein [Azoarcus]NMG32894.1 winged helix DNA-binding protein [Azoarcus sp. TTM-91]NMG65238.1 winged helix DNA-binding protein [Azoarcus indigens]TDN47947.1 putative MarR family transcription regulator [Azoarcus indigens]